MKYKILTFEQPIGEFALAVMNVKDILKIARVDRREFDEVALDSHGGPQRQQSTARVKEITKYSETADATFPTPILLALSDDAYTITDDYICIKDETDIASIIDGQHRMLGLEKSKYASEYNLPVVFVLDATEEQKALIFAIINGKQTRVPASVIYDLFAVVEGRNPFKTAHEIARAINSAEASPFYRRLKMLGSKSKGSNESLSQGTFVTQLLKHISSKPADDFNLSRSNLEMQPRPAAVFNKYFLENKDEVILKILLNLFEGCKTVFSVEWEDPNNYVLSKTTGYTGIMMSLSTLIRQGEELKKLDMEYFLKIFNELKSLLEINQLMLDSNSFPPSITGASKLRDLIHDALKKAFP